ncbi:MAG: hypothetical protein KF757_11270 [Phycisphaeraceae bacterium]|nr:hypothetical protein [Phycisphaeraceae bacterium]MCW5762266.1 hypothetical protein [Phycisphaeraceae bacterium]
MQIRKVALTFWLISPIAIVALLCFWIVSSQRAGPSMIAEPVGAGAGDTGGANALGEYLRQRRLNRQITIAVDVRVELSAGAVVLIGHRGNDWQGETMARADDLRWTATLRSEDLADGFELQVSENGVVRPDAEGRRMLSVSAGEQFVILRRTTP